LIAAKVADEETSAVRNALDIENTEREVEE